MARYEDENQPTLFDLHDVLDAAAYDKDDPFPKPRIGVPAAQTQDGDYVQETLYEACADDAERLDRRYRKLQHPNLMTASFVCERELKAALDMICRENGTTSSAFLRQCARRLVTEYTKG